MGVRVGGKEAHSQAGGAYSLTHQPTHPPTHPPTNPPKKIAVREGGREGGRESQPFLCPKYNLKHDYQYPSFRYLTVVVNYILTLTTKRYFFYNK